MNSSKRTRVPAESESHSRNRRRTSTPDSGPQLPSAPRSIAKGSTLKDLLDREAVECLAFNVRRVHRRFDAEQFQQDALNGLEPLGILDRGRHLARTLRRHLPAAYGTAVGILVDSLGPTLQGTEDLGLASFFYLPHVYFVSEFGVDPEQNGGFDPFEDSMRAQHAITRRFSAEFSMRAFLLRWPDRTLERLMEWTRDPDPHVRRLCSEGSRPRLPWAARLPAFIRNPRPLFPILEALKDDTDLYVRRSVANHVGDIAKDHPDLAFDLCRRWLRGASPERKWVIRHAVRHPARKNHPAALALRREAK